MAKQVPLVLYKGGVRTEVGMAQVEDDGSIVAQVAKDHWPLVRELFMPNIGEFSINPAPTKIVDTPYHNPLPNRSYIHKNETPTVVVDPNTKI